MLFHRLFTLLDQFLELRATPLLFIKLADEAQITAFQLCWFLTLTVAFFLFLSHVVDELERVEEDVLLSLVKALIRSMVRLGIFLYLLDLAQVNLFLEQAKPLRETHLGVLAQQGARIVAAVEVTC